MADDDTYKRMHAEQANCAHFRVRDVGGNCLECGAWVEPLEQVIRIPIHVPFTVELMKLFALSAVIWLGLMNLFSLFAVIWLGLQC